MHNLSCYSYVSETGTLSVGDAKSRGCAGGETWTKVPSRLEKHLRVASVVAHWTTHSVAGMAGLLGHAGTCF